MPLRDMNPKMDKGNSDLLAPFRPAVAHNWCKAARNTAA